MERTTHRGIRVKRRLAIKGLVLAIISTATPALAQEVTAEQELPQVSPVGSRIYVPADFARFAPRNALDMLRQVPGFAIREERQERGLGQATGNVLVNGQRASGKSNDVLDELSKIPAQNVIRIEIVDGATLDTQGLSGQVANIIARASTVSGQFAWTPEFRLHNTDPVLARFETSVQGTSGPVEFTLGLQNNAWAGGADGPTWIRDAGGELIDYRVDEWASQGNQPRMSGRFKIDGPGSSVANLNLSHRWVMGRYRETGSRTGPGLPNRFRNIAGDEDSYLWEVGGDLEFGVGPGRMKFIGLTRGADLPYVNTLITSFADGSSDTGSRFARSGKESERIIRGEYRWTLAGDWQVSAEGAFNSLDNVSRLFLLNPTGIFEEIPLPGGSARVEEDRYEVMASYGRSLARNLSMQLSGGAEYSRLSQIGGGGVTREFRRPKGQLNLAWKPSSRSDLNLKLERRVGQLNFFDFLAQVNLVDDREKAENPDLVPQQSWDVEVEWVRRLGRWGSTTVRPYLRLLEDTTDFIPIGATGETIGNLGSGFIAGLESRSTLNFDPLGWTGARLDARLRWQESGVEDPLTGEKRSISNASRYLTELSLRHDIPNTDWAWGGGLNYHQVAFSVRPNEISRQWEGPFWANLFLEHKDVFGLTVRGGVHNLLQGRSYWDRTVFSGRRTGPVAFTEWRDRRIGPIVSFSVRGKF
jgi:outer membrane receptor for ferrienterochelin and colicins